MPHGSAERTGRTEGGKLAATYWLGHTTGFGCGQPTSAWSAAVRSPWRRARARSGKNDEFWCIERLLPSPAPVWPWIHAHSESPGTGHVRPQAGKIGQVRPCRSQESPGSGSPSGPGSLADSRRDPHPHSDCGRTGQVANVSRNDTPGQDQPQATSIGRRQGR